MNDDYFKVLGKITVNFSSLEIYLSFLIWNLATHELKVGKIITSELSFKAKIALFASLYRYQIGDIKKSSNVDKLIKSLTKAEEKRNIVIHSSWLVDEQNTKVIRHKTTSKLKYGLKDDFEDFTIDDLNEISDFISDVGKDLGKLISSSSKKAIKLD